MIDPVDRAVRAIARRNSYALVWAQFGIAHLVSSLGDLQRATERVRAGDFKARVPVVALLDDLWARAQVPMSKQIGVALWAPRARAELGVALREEAGALGRAGAASVPD
jgi:hypothetical protein